MCAVEWKPLSEIFEMRGGYTPSTKNADFWEDGILPWFRMEDIREKGNILSDSTLHITPIALKKNGLFPQNSIILATSATIGVHALLTVPALSNQRFTAFFPKDKYEDKLNYKFAYYAFYLIDEWCKNNIVQGGFASVDMTGLKKYLFPIPSLAKQQEIVSRLDTFTTLISNLESELDMRRKQYDHYRNQLLDISGKDSKYIVPFGDICKIIRGNGVQKADFVEEGFGCIHYGQIYTYYGSYSYTTNRFVSQDVFNKAVKASKGDIIMTDTSENVEDICKSVAYLGDKDIAVSNHSFIIKHNQNPKYLSFCTLTYSFGLQKKKVVFGAKVSSIKQDNLAKINIYLPPIEEQNQIVSKLDAFENLIQSLVQEIKLRKQQYEYYREKLLTFE